MQIKLVPVCKRPHLIGSNEINQGPVENATWPVNLISVIVMMPDISQI